MERIINMEYSLNAILYVIGIQTLNTKDGMQVNPINENLQIISKKANSIWYRSEFPFCKESEYREEVDGYIVKHNNNSLQSKLQYHLSICNKIIQAWKNIKNVKNNIDFSLYLSLKKSINVPPFEYRFSTTGTLGKDGNPVDVQLLNPQNEPYTLIFNNSLIKTATNIASFLNHIGISGETETNKQPVQNNQSGNVNYISFHY